MSTSPASTRTNRPTSRTTACWTEPSMTGESSNPTHDPQDPTKESTMASNDNLTDEEEERITIAAATGRPITAGAAAGPVTTNLPTSGGPTERVSKSFILWLVLLSF